MHIIPDTPVFTQNSQKERRHSKTLMVRLASTSTELGGEGVGGQKKAKPDIQDPFLLPAATAESSVHGEREKEGVWNHQRQQIASKQEQTLFEDLWRR